MSERVAKTTPPVVFCACKTGCQLAMVGGEGLGPARNRSGPRAQDGGAALGMDLEVPLGFAGEEGGSFGVARHGPWAAPGRRSSAVGRPRTQTGCQLATTAASRGSHAAVRYPHA